MQAIAVNEYGANPAWSTFLKRVTPQARKPSSSFDAARHNAVPERCPTPDSAATYRHFRVRGGDQKRALCVRVTTRLPDPHLTPVYRLEATLAQPVDFGEAAQGHRRIVPLTGGTFTGPELNGKLLPGASADWQVVRADGTAFGDIRYTLQTDGGNLLYVQSRSVRHGSAEVLARLGRGEEVDASQYTFRTATQIETAAPDLDWLNTGVFISVGGRQAGGVIYETYLVA